MQINIGIIRGYLWRRVTAVLVLADETAIDASFIARDETDTFLNKIRGFAFQDK